MPQLTSGLRLGQGAGGFADWNELAELFTRATEAAGNQQKLKELCETSIRAALPEAVALMDLAPDLVAGTHMINAYADSMFFANVRYPTMRRTGARQLELVLNIPQRRGYRDCPAFFDAMAGVLRASSIFAGHAAATVVAHVQPYRASYEMTLPALEHQVLDDTEIKLRRSLFGDWQRQLRGLRADMLELRRREKQALELSTFAALSDALSRTLQVRELASMPTAAAAALRETLACGRVVIRKMTADSPTGMVLAECGLAGAKLVTFEAEVGTALLSVSADVARSSAAASALERLTPWLALVLGGAPPPLPAPTRSDNREGERLSELALRFGLTSRQAQVAWLMIQGESNKGIAVTLGCAEGTVEVHVQAVLAKSGVPGRAALASRFYERF